ncbi:MAG: DUF4199 domain-containing protein [Prevotella sp.]|nr:DUF4199 domain-containing protein [Prevotella sp.]
MTIPEYLQLRAFARIDGLKLFLLWLASFACYMAGLRSPGIGMVGMLLAVLTPFMTYRMVRRFRDNALDGTISFGRAWVYVFFVFFYASLLFAVAQFVYFALLDNGFFTDSMSSMLSQPETATMMKQMGMDKQQIEEAIQALASARPIDLSLNILFSNLFIGLLVGVPVAAFAQRNTPRNQPIDPNQQP